MFGKTRSWIRGVAVKLGFIKELQEISEHKKIVINEDAYERINKNKQIYAGHVKEWHDITYTNSNGQGGQKRTAISMGMGKVLAQRMASLIFNEKAKINIDDDGTSKFIHETLTNNKFYKNFQRYLEYAYALSGMAIKVYEHNGSIRLAYANADAFYPISNDSETIDEALFVNEEYKDGYYYTLLEWNEWEGERYKITNELYRSDVKGKLGHKVPLDTLYDGLEPEVYIDNLSRPVFVYFKLNTANNKDMTSPLGVSIFENAYDTLYMLDYMYDFWHNEFKLGTRRIAVDRSMLRPFPDSEGNLHMAFDTDETVFTPLNAEEQPIKDLSVELRADDIIKSINALLDILSMQTGFSSGTFTFDGKGVKTATEVVSENSMTYQTKNSHELLVGEGIKELVTTIMDVASLYDIYTGPTEFTVTVDFDDSIAQDRQENYNYYSLAAGAGLMPKVEAIQRIFGVPEKTAEEWLEKIQKQNVSSFTDEDSDMFGVPSTTI